jgi:hypothetical protein
MKKTIIILAMIVLLVPFVFADSPQFLTSDSGTGFLDIVYPQQEVYGLDDNITLNWVVFNSSGYKLNATSEVDCTFELRNSTNELLQSGAATELGSKFDQQIETGSIGIYGYVIYCNSSEGEYGFLSGYYYVTLSGNNFTPGTSSSTPLVIIFGVFSFCFILIYIAFKVNPEKHFYLQLIILLFVIVITVIIPKAILDYTSDFTTATTFYKAVTWFIRVFWIYVFFYVVFEFIKPLLENLRIKLK